MKLKKAIAVTLTMLMMVFSLAACTEITDTSETTTDTTTTTIDSSTSSQATSDNETSGTEGGSAPIATITGSLLDTSDMFTDRDLEQKADTSNATSITLMSGNDVTISEEGVYVLSGDAENSTVIVNVPDDAKVQIVLDGVKIVNEDSPAIYVISADKVFITSTGNDNHLEVTSNYTPDGDTNLDAVIYSKDDLIMNGTGALEVISAKGNGITSKDDLKVTGGIYTITAAEDGLEANDSIRINDGVLTIEAGADAMHSENDEDDAVGYIYIYGGTMNITAGDDAIRATSALQIDGGTINVETSTEGLEGTYLQINGGDITVYATDDGINATKKNSAYDVVIEVNGGTMNVEVGQGDTDAFDANGSIYINGGIINVTAPTSSFDADVTAELNGGTVTVNGEVITEIVQEMMGGHGGMRGGTMPDGTMPRPGDGTFDGTRPPKNN